MRFAALLAALTIATPCLGADAGASLPAPPANPGDEVRLDHDASGVAAQCQDVEGRMMRKMQWKVLRTLLSRNETYGVVWRSDEATPSQPSMTFRFVCWRASGPKSGISILTRPLDMLDPEQSIPPLPAAGRAQ